MKKRIKNRYVDIKHDVRKAFDSVYNNPESPESKYLLDAAGCLDAHKFAIIVTLKTGHKTTTIDRYRREFEAKRG